MKTHIKSRQVAMSITYVCCFLAIGCNKAGGDVSKSSAVPLITDVEAVATKEKLGSDTPDKDDPAIKLYGDSIGEEFAPLNSLASTPLRARKGDILYRLTNPKLEPVGRKPFPVLSVEYERLTDGVYGGQSLIVRDKSGRDQTILLFGPMNDRSGKLEIDLGIGGPGRSLPNDVELFLIRQEHRYPDGFRPTFKVSNSVTIGTPKLPLTFPRRWTENETAKLQTPPPEGPKPNANSSIGEDTAFAGDSKNGGSFRYAESDKKVIGVDYWAGEWDKEPCLARLIPVYVAKQPVEGVAKRVVAREGYAVGGITVRTRTFANSVQLVFMKIKSDGGLDPMDNYTSDWLGADVSGVKEIKLGGVGRSVIGFHCKQGAILNALALVMENRTTKK